MLFRSIVILSTHIVGDVIDVCRDMAILHQGKVLSKRDPEEAVAEIEGRIWQKTIARSELAHYEARLKVVSTRLLGGRTRVRVHADARPDPSFEPAPADLEDVYFSAIKAFS